MATTLHLVVSGRVQGVGYRDSLRVHATAAGLTGWVRNRRDGTVEAVLQGEAQAVAAVARWARQGPPAARVTGVVETTASGEYDERTYVGFERLPST